MFLQVVANTVSLHVILRSMYLHYAKLPTAIDYK